MLLLVLTFSNHDEGLTLSKLQIELLPLYFKIVAIIVFQEYIVLIVRYTYHILKKVDDF
jgi:hypothetical protein